MAFLPGLTAAASARTAEEANKKRNTDKKCGYRISLANYKTKTAQSEGNIVSRCQTNGNANKLEKVSIETLASERMYGAHSFLSPLYCTFQSYLNCGSIGYRIACSAYKKHFEIGRATQVPICETKFQTEPVRFLYMFR